MNYKIWNKKDAINGKCAEDILERNPEFKEKEVFLINNDYGITLYIEIVQQIKSILNLDKNLTAEQTAEAYLQYRIEQNKLQKEAIEKAEKEKTEIEKLKEQNTALLKISVENKLEKAKQEKQNKIILSQLAKLNLSIKNN